MLKLQLDPRDRIVVLVHYSGSCRMHCDAIVDYTASRLRYQRNDPRPVRIGYEENGNRCGRSFITVNACFDIELSGFLTLQLSVKMPLRISNNAPNYHRLASRY